MFICACIMLILYLWIATIKPITSVEDTTGVCHTIVITVKWRHIFVLTIIWQVIVALYLVVFQGTLTHLP